MRAPSFFTGFEDFEEPNEEPSRSDESDVSDSEAISGDLPTAAVPDKQPPQPVSAWDCHCRISLPMRISTKMQNFLTISTRS